MHSNLCCRVILHIREAANVPPGDRRSIVLGVDDSEDFRAHVPALHNHSTALTLTYSTSTDIAMSDYPTGYAVHDGKDY